LGEDKSAGNQKQADGMKSELGQADAGDAAHSPEKRFQPRPAFRPAHLAEKPRFNGGGWLDPAGEGVEVDHPEDGQAFGDIEPCHPSAGHGITVGPDRC